MASYYQKLLITLLCIFLSESFFFLLIKSFQQKSTNLLLTKQRGFKEQKRKQVNYLIKCNSPSKVHKNPLKFFLTSRSKNLPKSKRRPEKGASSKQKKRDFKVKLNFLHNKGSEKQRRIALTLFSFHLDFKLQNWVIWMGFSPFTYYYVVSFLMIPPFLGLVNTYKERVNLLDAFNIITSKIRRLDSSSFAN